MRRFVIRLGILGALFIQGALLGTVCHLLQQRQNSVDSAPPATADADEVEPLAAPVVQSEVNAEQIENWLQLGRQALLNAQPFEALPYYLRVVDHPRHISDTRTMFQIALAMESAGSLDEAYHLYRQVNDRATGLYLAAARVGMARCAALQGQTTQAQNILWGEFLNPSDPDPNTSGEVLHWMGMILASSVTQGPRDLILNPASLAEFPVRLEADRVLRRMLAHDEAADRQGSHASSQPPIVTNASRSARCEVHAIVQGDSLETTVINAQIHATPLVQILQQLALGLKFEVMISDAAGNAVNGFQPTVQVEARNLASLLDGLTIPYGLGWVEQNGVCYVMLRDEMSQPGLHRFQLAVTRRVLEQALLESPEHEFVLASRLAMADLDFWRGDAQNAIAAYREIVQRASDQRIIQTAYFNLAKVFRAVGLYQQAIDSLFRVVEYPTTEPEMHVAAYALIGQMQWEMGDSESAIGSWSRATMLASDHRHGPVAIVGLAMAQLLEGGPSQALQTVTRHRERLSKSDLQPLATFVADFARWQIPEQQNADAEKALIASLGHARSLVGLGPQEPMLYAQAFQALGFHKEAVEMWQVAASAPAHSMLQHRIFLSAAENLLQQSRISEAKPLLAAVQSSHDVELRSRAQMQLARLDFQAGEFENSFALAQQVLDAETDKDLQRESLELLGRIHQKWGNYDKAALCFAGLLPVVSVSEPQQSN